MNPFSRFLSQWSPNRRLKEFVERWDGLEALAIRVYKQGEARPDDITLFTEIQPWLVAQYPQLQASLYPHWQAALVGGRPAPEDPFVYLLRVESAQGFVGNWEALQFLPAGREAINHLLRTD